MSVCWWVHVGRWAGGVLGSQLHGLVPVCVPVTVTDLAWSDAMGLRHGSGSRVPGETR